MVVPIVAAGARAAAGAAGAGRTVSRAKPVRNPFPAERRGDASVPGRRGPRDAGGWRDVKKRRDLKENQRAVAEALERDDLEDEQREALMMERYRLQSIAERDAAYAYESQIAGEENTAGAATPEHRIGTIAMFFMLALAVLIDCLQFLLQFIPGVGQVIALLLAFIAGGFFFVWFHLLGVGYFSGKRAFVKIATILVMSVVELVPFINALPTLTIGVLAIILSSHVEDKLMARSSTYDPKKRGKRIPFQPQKLVRR